MDYQFIDVRTVRLSVVRSTDLPSFSLDLTRRDGIIVRDCIILVLG